MWPFNKSGGSAKSSRVVEKFVVVTLEAGRPRAPDRAAVEVASKLDPGLRELFRDLNAQYDKPTEVRLHVTIDIKEPM